MDAQGEQQLCIQEDFPLCTLCFKVFGCLLFEREAVCESKRPRVSPGPMRKGDQHRGWNQRPQSEKSGLCVKNVSETRNHQRHKGTAA